MIYDLSEAAKELKVDEISIYRICGIDAIKHSRTNGRIKISDRALADYVDSGSSYLAKPNLGNVEKTERENFNRIIDEIASLTQEQELDPDSLMSSPVKITGGIKRLLNEKDDYIKTSDMYIKTCSNPSDDWQFTNKGTRLMSLYIRLYLTNDMNTIWKSEKAYDGLAKVLTEKKIMLRGTDFHLKPLDILKHINFKELIGKVI